jgi:Ca2+-binding RTX toxin-like protein
MSQYPAIIDLAGLDGVNGFRIDGASSFDEAGISVASAGDVNGDGYGDLIVGAPTASDGGLVNSGASFVVFGRAGGFAPVLSLSDLDGSNGFQIGGAAAGDQAGHSVASAGDVNGDGFGDLIVGAPDINSLDQDGSAYVVFGHAGGFTATVSVADLDGTNGFSLTGADIGDQTGYSVASAGDVNGDGFADLIVGAPFGGSFAGSSYVVFGKASGFSPTLSLTDLNGTDGFRMDGASAFDEAGLSVASAGDVNGDGYGDLIVGAPTSSDNGRGNSGASFVVFGRAGGFAPVLSLPDLDGSNGFQIDGAAAGDQAGVSAASAGDVNGDGYDDLIVGAEGAAAQGPLTGAAYVIFGHAGGFASDVDVATLDGTNGFSLVGGALQDDAGASVASAGDVNGDGFADLIVGAIGVTAGLNAGAAYVVFGHAGGFSATLDLSTLDGGDGFAIPGLSVGDLDGWSVASAGDMNGDGLDDLIVGAPGAGSGGVAAGAAYVIYGRLPDTAVDLTGTAASQSLVGGDLDDALHGKQGDDALWGHDGSDTLKAGSGGDTITGGGGQDRMWGGSGGDTFVFQATSDSPDSSHEDVIKDIGPGDTIDLSAIDADTATTGDQAFHLVSAFGGHAGELVLVTTANGHNTYVEGDTDGDGTADFMLKLHGDHHDFTGFQL